MAAGTHWAQVACVETPETKETVTRLVVTNQSPSLSCDLWRQKRGPSPNRRGFCRDRSRYFGQVHSPSSLYNAEPGNWSDPQQHLAEHRCDVFKEWIWRRQHGSSASLRWWHRKGRADGQCDRRWQREAANENCSGGWSRCC